MNPVPYAIYKTWLRLVREHANVANQAAQLVLTIIDTTEQPLALFTYPTPASAAKLYDSLSYFLGKVQ